MKIKSIFKKLENPESVENENVQDTKELPEFYIERELKEKSSKWKVISFMEKTLSEIEAPVEDRHSIRSISQLKNLLFR